MRGVACNKFAKALPLAPPLMIQTLSVALHHLHLRLRLQPALPPTQPLGPLSSTTPPLSRTGYPPIYLAGVFFYFAPTCHRSMQISRQMPCYPNPSLKSQTAFQYLLRPNARLQQRLQRFHAVLRFNSPTIGVHVRHGDACTHAEGSYSITSTCACD